MEVEAELNIECMLVTLLVFQAEISLLKAEADRKKQAMHVCHTARVACRDVASESRSRTEHRSHLGHATRVPGGDIAIESRSIIEHRMHVGHPARVPG